MLLSQLITLLLIHSSWWTFGNTICPWGFLTQAISVTSGWFPVATFYTLWCGLQLLSWQSSQPKICLNLICQLHVRNTVSTAVCSIYIKIDNQFLNISWYLGASSVFIVSPPNLPNDQIRIEVLVSVVDFYEFNLLFLLPHSKEKLSWDQEMILKRIYFLTHAKLILGITLSYILYRNKNKKIKISKALNSALWIISLSLLLVVVFTTFFVS